MSAPQWLGRHPVRWVLLAATLIVAGVFLTPRASQALSALHHLHDANPAWLAAAAAAEALSLLAFSLVTWSLIIPACRPLFRRIVRLDLVSIALSHAVPAGSAAGTALGYELLEEEGIDPVQSAVVKITQSLLSAVLLQCLLGLSLALSIIINGPSASGIALTAAGSALVLLVGVFSWMLACRPRAVQAVTVRLLGAVPRTRAERAGEIVLDASRHFRALLAAPGRLVPACIWSLGNWVFDLAALWAALRAFGVPPSPVLLATGFCVAQVVASLPVSPAGLGVVEGSLVSVLIGFGTSEPIAVLGVLAWRLFNYWLPLPVGAAAYAAILADRHAARLISPTHRMPRLHPPARFQAAAGAPRALPPGMATAAHCDTDDQYGHRYRQCDQQVQRVAADSVIAGGDVITSIRMVPATIPFAWRSPSMKRAPVTTAPPYRSKKPSAFASRSLVSPAYLPNRSTSARPPKKPIA